MTKFSEDCLSLSSGVSRNCVNVTASNDREHSMACGSLVGFRHWCRSAGMITSAIACSALQARTSESSTKSLKAWSPSSASGLETQAVSIGQDRKAGAVFDWVGSVPAKDSQLQACDEELRRIQAQTRTITAPAPEHRR